MPNSNLRKKAQGPLSQLEADSEEKRIIFPFDLNEIGNFVAFDIHRYEFMAKEDLQRVNAIKSIFLPLPSNLGTQYTQGFNTEGVGPAGLAGAEVGEASRSPNVVDSLVERARNLSKEDLGSGLTPYLVQGLEEGVGQVAGAVVGGLPGIIAGGAAQQALRGGLAGAGVARNPHLAVLYDGPEFRTHTFQYKFVPKNESESQMLDDIVYDLKYHSSPGYVAKNSHFFDYPELFEISFSFPDFLFDVAPSFLTGVEVDYHGEGIPQYHTLEGTKAPVSVNLNLTFQEATIQTKETIRKYGR